MLEEYVADHPDSAAGQLNLGNLRLQLGRYEEAIEALIEAEKELPTAAQTDLWSAYMFAGRWDDARSTARRVEESDQEPLRWIGFALEGLQELYFGQVDAGLELLRRGRDLYPEGNPLRRQPEDVYLMMRMRTGRTEGVREELLARVANEKDPDTLFDLHAGLALNGAMTGHDAESRDYAERVDRFAEESESKSDRREAVILRGLLALFDEDYPAAVEALTEANELLPEVSGQSTEYADVWFGLGEALWQQGRQDEAAPWFQKLADSDEERMITPMAYVRSFAYLGEFHEQQGNNEQARANYQTFLDYWGEGEIDPDRVRDVRTRLDGLR